MATMRMTFLGHVGYSVETWRKMAELGWTGLIYPERYGGSGLDLVDLVGRDT